METAGAPEAMVHCCPCHILTRQLRQAVDLLLQLPSLPLFPLLRDKNERLCPEIAVDAVIFHGRWLFDDFCDFFATAVHVKF